MQYIYIVHSNPLSDLHVTEEMALINNCIPPEVGKAIQIPNAGLRDIIDQLLKHRNRYIFHYCGHSSSDGPLLKEGIAHGVYLYKLLRDFEVIFINGCDSHDAIKDLLSGTSQDDNLKVVISTLKEVGDQKAIEFAQDFYRKFFDNHSIKEAFEFALNAKEANPGEENINDQDRNAGRLMRHQVSKTYQIDYKSPEYKDLKYRATHRDEVNNAVTMLIADLLEYTDKAGDYNRNKILRGDGHECTLASDFLKAEIFPFVRSYIGEFPIRDRVHDLPIYDDFNISHVISVCSKIFEVIMNTICHVAMADLWDEILKGKVAVTETSREILIQFLSNNESASIYTFRIITSLIKNPFVPNIKSLVDLIEWSCAYFEQGHHKEPANLNDTVFHMSKIIGETTQVFRDFEFKSIRDIKYKSLRHFIAEIENTVDVGESKRKLPKQPYCEYNLDSVSTGFTRGRKREVLRPILEKAPVASESVYMFKSKDQNLVVSPFIIDLNCLQDAPADYCYFNSFENDVFTYTSYKTRKEYSIDPHNDIGLYQGNLLPQITDLIERVKTTYQ